MTPEGVIAAVEKELADMPPEIAESAVAATALAMARELDDSDNSATSKSMCAGKLIDAMERLRASASSAAPPDTKLDEIARRREERLARRTGT